MAADIQKPNLSSDPALIIFDFDGVIADSEVISLTTLGDALRTYQVDLSLTELRHRFLGRSIDGIIADLRSESDDSKWDSFASDWQSILFDRFKSELSPLPGIGALLDRIEASGLSYCIASSSRLERIHFALNVMGLAERFPHVFSAQEVRRGKPAPDLFLHAAKQLGAVPECCVVIEDSQYGVQAARAADMQAFGFVGGAHLKDIQNQHQDLLLAHGAEAVWYHLDQIDFQDLAPLQGLSGE